LHTNAVTAIPAANEMPSVIAAGIMNEHHKQKPSDEKQKAQAVNHSKQFKDETPHWNYAANLGN